MKITRATNHIIVPVNGFSMGMNDSNMQLHALVAIGGLNGDHLDQFAVATLVMDHKTVQLLHDQLASILKQMKNPAQYVKSSLQPQ